MANAIELYGGHSMTHSNDYRPCAPRPSLTYCKLVTVLDIRENLAPVLIARRMGNSADLVQRTYAHLWRDDDDRTRDAIDRYLQVS